MCEHARSMGSETDAPTGFHRRVFTQLRGLFATLQDELRDPKDQSAEKIARVSDVIAAAQLDRAEWGDFTSWRGDKYTRNLVAHDENFTVLMLCWNKGQKSPIHDHAGSSCWVRVLDGELRERRFAMPVEGPVHAPDLLSDATVAAGEVTYIDDTQALHEMGNWHPDKVTVTMHVYSPPYFKCFAFDEFTGARRNVSMLAATAPPREILGADETDEMETPLSPSGKPLRLEDLEAMLDAPDSTEASIVDAFKHVRFTREEWSTFAHFSDLRYQRLMLHHNTRFSLLMLCWLPGQATPPHTHVDSRSWVRVLAGELTYTEPALVREGSQEVDLTAPPRRVVVMRRGDPPFAEDDALAVHQVGNMGKRFAVSLHLYTPPYTEFRNAETTVPFVHAQRRLLHAAAPCCPGARKSSPDKDKPSESNSALESRTTSSVMTSCNATPPQRCHLSGFYVLVERLTEIFALPAARHPSTGKLNLPELSEAVMRAMEAQQFDAAEVARYWGVRERIDYRVKLHESADFDVVLNLWAVGHHSVVHDHDGAVSWMKVLEGNLLDITYDEDPEAEALVVEGTTRAQTGSVLFHGARSRHALRSPGPHPAISLHVYAPGGKGCKWYTLAQPRHGVRVQSVTASEGDAWNILGPVVQHDGVTGAVRGLPLDFAYCI